MLSRLKKSSAYHPAHKTRFLGIRGLTALLIFVAIVLPVLSTLAIDYWMNDDFDWQVAALDLGVACLSLAIIAFPTIYLLDWESRQAQRWDDTFQDFRLLIDQAVDMVFLHAADGKIIEANQRACEVLGYRKGELLQLSILDLDIDCYLHRHPKLVHAMQAGDSVTYETRYRAKSGGRLPVECRARLASWLEQPHYIEFVSDISHRRQVEKEIDASKEALEKTRNLLEMRIAEHSSEIQKQKQSREMAERYANSIQEYLEKLIDSMPSAIIAVDQQSRVMQWNLAAQQLTGIAAKMAIGESLAKLFPQLDQQVRRAREKRDLLEQNLSFRFNQQSGENNLVLEVMIYPIFSMREEDQGEVFRIDDITEKLKIEETLVQTEKMLSLGGLAAGMAHEINNPLGAIMQSAQNVRRRLSQELSRNQEVAESIGLSLDQLQLYLERQRIMDFLDGILVSGQRAADIVKDMLSFARPGGRQSKGVCLQDSMDSAVRLSTKTYEQDKSFDFRQIEIRRTYAPDLIYIEAQKNQLEQVLLNLLLNAAQAFALSQKSQLNPLIELIVRRDGRYACVEVIDNGPGMEESVRKRVFEPFFTTKAETTGTGLGLSVSYFIVTEQLGGQMAVESQPGRGARFSVYLPYIGNAKEAELTEEEQIELPLGP